MADGKAAVCIEFKMLCLDKLYAAEANIEDYVGIIDLSHLSPG